PPGARGSPRWAAPAPCPRPDYAAPAVTAATTEAEPLAAPHAPGAEPEAVRDPAAARASSAAPGAVPRAALESALDAEPALAPEAWLPWLVRLRWGAVAGQLVTAAAARLAFGLPVPTAALLAVVAFTAASNVGLGWRAGRARNPGALFASVLALDVLLFTGLLGLTGGPANPFSVLYLVPVALAALVFGLRWSIALAGLCAAAYATLFWWHVPIDWGHGAHAHAGAGHAIGLHLQGMWAATALAAAILGYFVSRTAAALRAREAEVRRLARAAARDERLVALSAL